MIHQALLYTLLTYLFVSSFYVLFSAYATWHRMQKEGTLSGFDWFMLGPWALFGYVEDLLFNAIFGTTMYLEAPWSGAGIFPLTFFGQK